MEITFEHKKSDQLIKPLVLGRTFREDLSLSRFTDNLVSC